MPLVLLDHPLAGHLLAELRDASTSPERFRRATRTLTTLLALSATRDLATKSVEVQTPLGPARARVLAEPLAVVPILRAGLGMAESAVELYPDVSIGYVGLERHEETAVARSYYCKLPPLEGRFTLVLDPMLATGGTASQAVRFVREAGGERVAMACVVAAPEGLARMAADHPEVAVYAAALDDRLDARKFIVPGLGDFGDRLYGTS